MNNLSLQKKAQILHLLVEGNSLRASARIAEVCYNSCLKLLVSVGKACQQFHNEHVVDVNSRRIQADEIWSFVYAKEKNAEKTGNPQAGDAWTWVAMDPQTKLVVSWHIGKRDARAAKIFMEDVRERLRNKVQLTTDGFRAYLDAVEDSFEGNIDYAQLVKIYGRPEKVSKVTGKPIQRVEYIGADKTTINGSPDKKHISTSMVERQNLTMRQSIRRFTRKTNGYSKKLENHGYAIALHFVYYNFVRIHTTLRVTPAMQAGLATRWMELIDIVKLAEPKPDME